MYPNPDSSRPNPTSNPPGEAMVSRREIIAHYGKGLAPILAVVAIVGLIEIGLQLLQPWPTKVVIDSVFGDTPAPGIFQNYTHTEKLLFFMVAAVVGLFVVQKINDYIGLRLSAWANFKVDKLVRNDVFGTIISLPAERKSLRTGEYDYRLNDDARAVADRLIGLRVTWFQSTLMVGLALIILFSLNVMLTLIALIIVPVLVGSIKHFAKPIEIRTKLLRESLSSTRAFTVESISQSRLIQTFVKESDQKARFVDLMTQNYRTGLNKKRLLFRFGLVNGSSSLLSYASLLLLGGHLILNGHLTIGELIIFFNYTSMLNQPLQALTNSVSDLKALNISIDRVGEVFGQLKADPHYNRGGRIRLPTPVAGDIVYQQVTYEAAGKTILRDVSLHIAPGERVAFVGPSGSGKSTVLNLLMGFADPTHGRILIDNVDVTHVAVEELRSVMGVVEQEAQLLSMSVDDNIAFGVPVQAGPGYRQEVIGQASLAANAFDFIMQLPASFQTVVGERGANLSGGQRQRIAIARALARNAPIVLLDEPTSALDDRSAKQVTTAITNLMKGRTVLMVTHDLRLLQKMDHIFVVDGGQVLPIEAHGGLEAYKKLLD